MQFRQLGRTGLKVSEIGFGGAVVGIANYIEAWDPHDPACRAGVTAAIDRALDLGINYLDTAEGYGAGASEEIMGGVIGRRRDECILATKVSSREPEAIRASCEASLRRLQTDVIDVYQFHGSWYDREDVKRILGGGLEMMHKLRDEGKVRFIGFTTEAPTGEVSELISTGAFDVLQIRYNLMYQHACDLVNGKGVMQDADAAGMGIVIMRPLTSGTYHKLIRTQWPDVYDAKATHRLLLNYVLSNPLVDVAIVGMRREWEVESNNAISDDTGSRIDLIDLHDRFIEPDAV